jgi:hypothetical protein
MKRAEAYRKVDEILEEYNDKTEARFDDLDATLGEMAIELWDQPKDKSEIITDDPVVFSDWTKTWVKIVGGKDEDGTNEQIFKVAKTAILDYYSIEVEYDLGDAEKYLKEKLLEK